MGRSSTQPSGFTLVELILVMLLMVTVTALAVPSLSRSFRDRHLSHEGLQFLALVEQCRSEAISEGVPMVLWLDTSGGRYGLEPKAGFSAGPSATHSYQLGEDIHFASLTQALGKTANNSEIDFSADGVPEAASFYSVQLLDRFGSHLTISRTDDNWTYEILKESP